MDDRAAVEQAVRAYFDTVGSSSPEHLAGPLAAWFTLIAATPEHTLYEKPSVTVAIRRLEVTHVERDQAVVALDALVETDVRHSRAGRIRHASRHAGPLVVERVDGTWKLVDWSVDGRRVVAATFPEARAARERGGITVELLGARLTARATWAVLRIVNTRGHAVTLRRAALGHSAGRGWRYAQTTADELSPVPAGTSLRSVYSPRVVPLSARRLRVVLELEDGHERIAIDLPASLSGPAEAGPPQPSGPLPRALRVRFRLNRRVLALAFMVALCAGFAAAGLWAAAAVAAFAQAAMLLSIVRRDTRLAGSRSAAIVAAPLAVAGVLVAIGVFSTVRTFSPSGCDAPPGLEADAFVRTLVTEGQAAATARLPSFAKSLADGLPVVPNRGPVEVRRILASRQADAIRCHVFLDQTTNRSAEPGVIGPCFAYDLDPSPGRSPSGAFVVAVACDGGRWRVNGLG